MDQCAQCECRGNTIACELTECTWHDTWYTRELGRRLAEMTEKAFRLLEEKNELLRRIECLQSEVK